MVNSIFSENHAVSKIFKEVKLNYLVFLVLDKKYLLILFDFNFTEDKPSTATQSGKSGSIYSVFF
jgi:hypothetical protein